MIARRGRVPVRRARQPSSTARAKRSATRTARRSWSARCSSLPISRLGRQTEALQLEPVRPPRRAAPLLQQRPRHLDVELQAPARGADPEGLHAGGAAREHDGPRGRGCSGSCATRGRRARRGPLPPAAHPAGPPRRRETGTQPISPAGRRSALPSRACAISCAPRQMPSTGNPRAWGVGDDLALAVERRIAVCAVGVDDAAQHDQRRQGPPSATRAARGVRPAARCARRVPSAAARARRAGSRSRAGRRALSGSRSRPHLRPSARARRAVAMVRGCARRVLLAMGLLYVVWGSTYLAIRVTGRDAAPAGRRRPALHPRRAAHARRAGGAGAPGAATEPRRSCAARRLAGIWLLIGGVGIVTVTEAHGAVQPGQPCSPPPPRSGSSAIARWRASASDAGSIAGAALRSRRRDRPARARRHRRARRRG